MNPNCRKSCRGFELLETRHMLSTYFVDADNGNDLQSVGSITQPFATIQRATLFAMAGDTVAIREGVYREQVELTRSGAPGNPITFEAYNGENVLVTTTEKLTGWTQYSGNIYKTTFNSSVMGRNGMTLFADGELMFEAHWSSQGANVSTLNKNNFATMESSSTVAFTDTALIGLPDDYWNGAFVWAQTANFFYEARRVVDFNGASGTITVSSPLFYNPYGSRKFLIYDHINALDAPGEWYFDEATNTLYFWTPGGGDPDNYDIEAKVRDDGFDLNGHDYIQIKDIDFRGGDLGMSGADHILLQGAHIVAPDRGFGPEGSGGAQALYINGSNNVIRDNEVEQVWSTVAQLIGDNNEIVNNYFHEIGYVNSNDAGAYIAASAEETLISHNTITEVGRVAIGGAGGMRSVIEYNDISETGRMSDDGGAIYFADTSLGNTIIHHNVVHDISNALYYGIYFDSNSSDVVVHHNLTYNIGLYPGIVNIPNNFVLWFNNTHYSTGSIHGYYPPGSAITSTGSKFFNNIISSLDTTLTTGASPAEASNNYLTSSSSNFVNAAAGDFRLVGGSGAVDYGREIAGITDGFGGAAPDAGALELGEAMWEYGHNFAIPPNPVYAWEPAPYSNRVVNPSFENALSGWAVSAGSPALYAGNAWNYQSDGLATFGSYALELSPGDEVTQTINGLLPNTTYEITTQARLVKDLQLENYDGSLGSFTTGFHREENYISDVNTGEWVRFDDVDFGSGSSLYNRIEIGTTQNDSLNIALRLDSPTGQLIGTLNVPTQTDPWFMTQENITSVTGTHDLYVVFLGNGGTNGKFDRIRLLDTNVSESVTFGVRDYDSLGSESSISIGDAYWSSVSDGLTFTTGPNASSATIFIGKNGGSINGYVDLVTFTGDMFLPSSLNTLDLIIEPDSGRTVLRNNTPNPVQFDAYTIFDVVDSMLPDDWFSLQDQGYNNKIWFEASPNTNRLTELTSNGVTTLEVSHSVYLGALVNPVLADSVTFDYFLSSTETLTRGTVRFEDPGLPELSGDYNGDLVVSGLDFLVWQTQLGTAVDAFDSSDGNGNGIVDAADLELWQKQFGQSAVPSIQAAYVDPGDSGGISLLAANEEEELPLLEPLPFYEVQKLAVPIEPTLPLQQQSADTESDSGDVSYQLGFVRAMLPSIAMVYYENLPPTLEPQTPFVTPERLETNTVAATDAAFTAISDNQSASPANNPMLQNGTAAEAYEEIPAAEGQFAEQLGSDEVWESWDGM